jgi:Tol biopolymer transport system component
LASVVAGQLGKDPAFDRRAGLLGATRFSPDGQQLALAQQGGDDRGVFVYDLRRDAMLRVTFGVEQSVSPMWSLSLRILAHFSSCSISLRSLFSLTPALAILSARTAASCACFAFLLD